MSRIKGVEGKEAGLFTRLVYFLTRRRLGCVITPIAVTAHHPRLLRAHVHMELGQAAATSMPVELKALVQVKVAMMIGCPF